MTDEELAKIEGLKGRLYKEWYHGNPNDAIRIAEDAVRRNT